MLRRILVCPPARYFDDSVNMAPFRRSIIPKKPGSIKPLFPDFSCICLVFLLLPPINCGLWIFDAQYVGGAAVGDKPVVVPNPNYCPATPWGYDMLPGLVMLDLIDIEKGSLWDTSYPEPPNGRWAIPFLNCSMFFVSIGEFLFYLTWTTTEFFVEVIYQVPFRVFDCHLPFVDPAGGDNLVIEDYTVYRFGRCILTSYLSGSSLPASWDAAPLVGVPASAGYLAEELPPTQYDRYIRYVNNRNNTNIKIIGNF